MAFKKINKANLTGVVITMLLVLGIFFGMFNWYSGLASDSGSNIGEQYSNMSTALTTDQLAIKANIENIKGNLSTGVTEADSVYQATWNSFKGLGNILKMPLTLITVASDMLYQFITPVDFIPQWVKDLTTIGLVAVIVLLIVALLKGEQNKT